MEKDSLDLWSPQLRNHRGVDVYLPDSYGERRQRYPVVYMQDGQNLSDPAIAFAGNTWHLDEGLPWLAARGIEPIVVGVHNTGPRRLAEYSPFPDAQHGGGDGDRYLRFLIDTVKPRIDASYRTRKDRDSTIIGGLDGRIDQSPTAFPPALAVWRGAVLSPSVWFGGREIRLRPEGTRVTRGRLYLDVGTAEGIGTLRDARALNRLLREYADIRAMPCVTSRRGARAPRTRLGLAPAAGTGVSAAGAVTFHPMKTTADSSSWCPPAPWR